MTRFLSVILCLCTITGAQAQDAQFWHNHYGTKGVLLGGAVIGSVEDLSAVFYNPGYLGLKQNPGLAFGTSVFDFSYLALETDTLLQQPLDRITAESAPGLIAGQIEFSEDAENYFTYSLIGRQAFNTVIQGRSSSSSGLADRLASLYLRQDLAEYWAGVTWSRRVHSNVGIGVSLFGAHRNQRRRSEISLDTAFPDNSVSHSTIDVGWNFWNLRLLAKIGVFWTEGPWSAGATITTQGVPLFGYGDAYGTAIRSGTSDDRLTNYSNPGSNTTYHSPWSVGIGAGYRMGDIRLHGSLEWFSAVSAYQVMDPIVPTTISEAQPLSVVDQMRSIVNVGAGIEVTVSDRFSWFGSIVSDLSTVSSSYREVLALSSWDIIHVNGGAVVQIDRFLLTGGLGLAFGAGNPILVAYEDLNDGLKGLAQDVNVVWGRLRAVLGLTYTP